MIKVRIWECNYNTKTGLGQPSYGAVKARKEPFKRGKILIEIGLGLFILILTSFKLFFQ
ncbi:MAG: hypothetical protein WB014_00350 [Methanosarcina sp.]